MLSFTDIYGPPQYSAMANAALPGHASTPGDSGLSGTPVVNMADLQRRVERLLANRENNNLNSNSVSMQTSEQEAIYANLVAPATLLSCISFDQSGKRTIFFFVLLNSFSFNRVCFHNGSKYSQLRDKLV